MNAIEYAKSYGAVIHRYRMKLMVFVDQGPVALIAEKFRQEWLSQHGHKWHSKVAAPIYVYGNTIEVIS